jgi:hypothetical protein
MKKKTMMTMLMLALLGMTACTTEEPTPIIQEDPYSPVLPVGDFKMWPTPTIDDSNLTGEGYNYDYWKEHNDEAKTGDELLAMCNVPEDLLKNMSTPNLAWTCFNHPYNGDWFAFNSAYDGILSVMTRSNGYEELMKRKSGAEATIDLYTQLGYGQEGKTTVNESSMIAWTLVLCTAADYRAFDQTQIARLAEDVLYKDHLALVTSSSNLYLSHKSYCLLGAFMAYHYDDTLPEEQRVLLGNFIKNLSMTYYIDDDNLTRSYTIIKNSLERLAAGTAQV